VTLHSRVGSHHGLHVKRGPLLGEEVARARSAIHVAERVEGRSGGVRHHELRVEAGSYSRLINSCFTQLQAQGPTRTCNENKEQDEEVPVGCETMSCGLVVT